MGYGKKVPYTTTYLTGKTLYRTVTANDTGPAQSSPAIPDLRLDIDSSRSIHLPTVNNDVSGTASGGQYGLNPAGSEVEYTTSHGYNSQLVLYVIAAGGANPVLNVYAWAQDDAHTSGTDVWALFETVSALGANSNSVVQLQNIPANRYRITVTGVGSGSVKLVEQHSE